MLRWMMGKTRMRNGVQRSCRDIRNFHKQYKGGQTKISQEDKTSHTKRREATPLKSKMLGLIIEVRRGHGRSKRK